MEYHCEDSVVSQTFHIKCGSSKHNTFMISKLVVTNYQREYEQYVESFILAKRKEHNVARFNIIYQTQ